MDGVDNGVAVAVEALEDDLDLVDVLWCAALEAARLHGIVDAGVRRHGGQAKGGAQANAMKGHLIDTVFNRGMRSAGVSPGAFTLSASCFNSIFSQLSSASRDATLQGNGG
jgi:hypothetical protein